MNLGGHPSLVAIAFGSGRISAVSVVRRGGRCHVRRVVDAPMSLDPLKDAPELVGREIHNALFEGGIRQRKCAVLLPLEWAFILRTSVPQLTEVDGRAFLNTQVEREIPVPLANLLVSVADGGRAVGGRFLTLAAIPRTHVSALLRVLKAARLRPVRMTFGVTALTGPGQLPIRDHVALLVGHDGCDLAVLRAGDLVALRTLAPEPGISGRERMPDPELVAKQVRITLGELPGDLAGGVWEVLGYGLGKAAPQSLRDLGDALREVQLSLSMGDPTAPVPYAPDECLEKALAFAPAPLTVAGKCLMDQPTPFEFLPARAGLLRRTTRRISSRKTRWAVAVFLALFCLVGGPFLFQQTKLARLEARWLSMQPKVGELEVLQDKVRGFGAWYSDSTQSLAILRALTEAFPEEGVIWARKVTMREATEGEPLVSVSCTGYARTREAWLDLLDRLRSTTSIVDLRFKQLRGETPTEFEVDFNWSPGEADES